METWVGSLDLEDPLEEGMATHSSTLVWRIPMDRGTWWATAHGVAKSWAQLVTKHSTMLDVAWTTQAQHIRNKMKPYDLLPQHAKATSCFPEPLNKYIFRVFLCTMYHSRH